MSVECCNNCQERTTRCHITCEIYKNAVKRHNEDKERERKWKKEHENYNRLRVIHSIKASIRKKDNM